MSLSMLIHSFRTEKSLHLFFSVVQKFFDCATTMRNCFYCYGNKQSSWLLLRNAIVKNQFILCDSPLNGILMDVFIPCLFDGTIVILVDWIGRWELLWLNGFHDVHAILMVGALCRSTGRIEIVVQLWKFDNQQLCDSFKRCLILGCKQNWKVFLDFKTVTHYNFYYFSSARKKKVKEMRRDDFKSRKIRLPPHPQLLKNDNLIECIAMMTAFWLFMFLSLRFVCKAMDNNEN